MAVADSRSYTASVIVGHAADRPPAGRSARLFVADDTNDLWFDEGQGQGWVSVGKGAVGDAFKGVEVASRWGEKWLTNPNFNAVLTTSAIVGCVGDSCVEGVGTLDYWPMILSRVLAREVSNGINYSEANAAGVYGGYQHLEKAEWVRGADFVKIATSSTKDQAPHRIGYECLVGGTAAGQTATWTRPAGLASCARFHIIWGDINTAGSVGWSYSTNGGGAWVDVPVTNPGAITLKRVAFNASNPTDIRVRAAKADGTASRIPAIYGIVALTDTGYPSGDAFVLHNWGRSSNFLSNLDRATSGDPFGVMDFVFQGPSNLLIVGPFTNDAALGGDVVGYGTHLQNVVNRFASKCDVLVIGQQEQQLTEVYTGCVIANGSPNVTVPGGNFSALKDLNRTMSGTGIPSGTLISAVTDATHVVLTANATQSGTVSLTFDGRPVADQDAYRAQLRQVALSSGCAYLDLKACWGDFRTSWTNGYMLDTLHPSQQGHKDIAARVARLLRTLS